MKDVYTFEDLENWDAATADLERKPLLAVIGDPVDHSKSPQMHQPALDEGENDGLYIRLHLTPEQVPDALEKLPELGFLGINITIPHKAAALAACDLPETLAQKMGAVNTLLFEDGKTLGTNTDGQGFVRAVREEFSLHVRDLRVLVVGVGGGAGRAVAVQCAAEGVPRLVLANRTVEKAQTLAEELAPMMEDDRVAGPADRLSACGTSEADLREVMERMDLIVNATPLGMKRGDAEPFPLRLLRPHHLVHDMVYKSGGETALVAACKEAGGRACDGLPMLLHQGALAYEYWFNKDAPVELMREGLRGGK